jgi:hypothetical protein
VPHEAPSSPEACFDLLFTFCLAIRPPDHSQFSSLSSLLHPSPVQEQGQVRHGQPEAGLLESGGAGPHPDDQSDS